MRSISEYLNARIDEVKQIPVWRNSTLDYTSPFRFREKSVSLREVYPAHSHFAEIDNRHTASELEAMKARLKILGF